tara:strand:- start:922 stop:1824 length:903 start_codon:yes stop_codon:yes gene_type:complete
MDLRKILIFYRANSTSSKEAALYCKDKLNRNNIVVEVIINKDNNHINDYLLESNDFPDLVIVLGGDGTVLRAASALQNYKIPILSFNIGGNLGFLTHERSLLLESNFIQMIKDDNFIIEKRMMLKASINSKEISDNINHLPNRLYALNDFYFRTSNNNPSSICHLELEIEKEKVDQHIGDGIIVATPTGSTAYSMASGGPIVHPKVDSIIVTPISPISLSSRSIIVPKESELKVKIIARENGEVCLWKDGKSAFNLKNNDYCTINISDNTTNLMLLNNHISYYETLSTKLNWAGNIINKD